MNMTGSIDPRVLSMAKNAGPLFPDNLVRVHNSKKTKRMKKNPQYGDL
jgi:hypothetical protein